MRRTATVTTTAILGVVLSTVTPSGATVEKKRPMWRGDFQTGSLDQWTAIQRARKSSITVTSKVHAPGSKYAARFIARRGDDVLTSADNIRAEVWEETKEVGATSGRTRWYGWRTMLPKKFDTAPQPSWLVLTQWHQSGADASPNISLSYTHWNTEPKKLTLSVKGGTVTPGDGQATSTKDYDIGTPRVRHWYRFALRVHWSPSPKHGSVVLWVDGRKVFHAHVATLYTGEKAYLKQGIYGSAASSPITVFHSGMRVGTSRKAVT